MLSRLLHRIKGHLQRRGQVALRQSENCLQVLLFHGICDSPREALSRQVDPGLFTSLEMVVRSIQQCRDQGFEFVHAGDLSNLHSGRKAVLTLDDGYANNLQLLPLLHQLKVPACLFVTTSNTLTQQCFWWDVLARESRSDENLSLARQHLKRLKPSQIVQRLKDAFGPDCVQPMGDLDRPLNEHELRDLAADPWVTLGNHSHEHGLFTQLSRTEITQEIQLAQQHLTRVTGKTPRLLAYPNGRHHAEAREVAAACGIELAFGTDKLWSALPLCKSQHLAIPRVMPSR